MATWVMVLWPSCAENEFGLGHILSNSINTSATATAAAAAAAVATAAGASTPSLANDLVARPVPPANELSRPYWEAAAQGRLVIQACAQCGTRRHYPRLLCTQCFSDAAVWHTATGRGTLHSWTVSHHAFHPSFKSDLPYTLVTVDLEEGVRALGRWVGPAALSMGQPVQGQFEAQSAPSTGFDLVFRPRAG